MKNFQRQPVFLSIRKTPMKYLGGGRSSLQWKGATHAGIFKFRFWVQTPNFCPKRVSKGPNYELPDVSWSYKMSRSRSPDSHMDRRQGTVDLQARIQDFGQGGPSRVLTPRGGALSLKFAQNRVFPLKFSENCMILKKSWGQGGPGPQGPPPWIRL